MYAYMSILAANKRDDGAHSTVSRYVAKSGLARFLCQILPLPNTTLCFQPDLDFFSSAIVS